MNDLLLDVPRNRTKLEVWKERHGIWTQPSSPEVDGFVGFASGKKGALESDTGEDEEASCFATAERLRLPWLESISQKDLTIPNEPR